MAIFTLLASAWPWPGRHRRIERFADRGLRGLSALMNYAAADMASWRSVVAPTSPPPLFLALMVDRVDRRHPPSCPAADAESVWVPLGRALAAAGPGLAALVLLYLLRFVLAPPSTGAGLRRVVLNAAPLPAAPEPAGAPVRRGGPGDRAAAGDRAGRTGGRSKKARLAWWYQQDPDYGKPGRRRRGSPSGSRRRST